MRALFDRGLLGHVILERFPEEQHWMCKKMGDWEVIYRREQIQFIEGRGKPKPIFSDAPKLKVSDDDYLPLPALATDKPHLKAVAIKATVWRSDMGEGVENWCGFRAARSRTVRCRNGLLTKSVKRSRLSFPAQRSITFPNKS
ncbi:MAG: hypothetical protein GXP16_07075 [Gammaproteobacteria bacterium]|nr:hypothetical protein [Gammaproteobacteria bacterium]